jgi:Domain of unknown function (DUF397)
VIWVLPSDLPVIWRKSTYSSSNGQCVEVAFLPGTIAVRDTKAAGAGPILVFSAAEWEAFVNGVKGGEFDLP